MTRKLAKPTNKPDILTDDDGTINSNITATVTGTTWSVNVDTAKLTAQTEVSATVTVSDAAGNTSTTTQTKTYSVDDTAPDAPDNLVLDDDDVTAADKASNLTNQNNGLTITGTAEAGATVLLFKDDDGDGLLTGREKIWEATVNGTNFTVELDGLDEGLNKIRAIQTDAAGNESLASTALEITLDTIADAPTNVALSSSDDNDPSTLNITNISQDLTITGTVEDGASVILFDDADNDSIKDADETVWTATVTGTTFTAEIADTGPGNHTIRAIQTDKAGNVSTASIGAILVDTLAPGAPSSPDLDENDDTGTSNSDNITSQPGNLTFKGTAEAGTEIIVFVDADDDQQFDEGEGIANGIATDGTYTIDLSGFTGTRTIRVVSKDAAGNISAASTPLTYTVDPFAPDAPDNLVLDDDDDSGLSTTDNITKNTNGLTITGSAEEDAFVTLFDDKNDNGVFDAGDVELITVVAGASGFTADVTLSAGDHTIRAYAKDEAGNKSGVSGKLAITVDDTTAIPNNLELDEADDSGLSTTDNITKTTNDLTITGKVEAGASVTLFDDKNDNGVMDAGEQLGQAVTADGQGNFTADLTLGQGIYNIRAYAQDKVGNESEASAALGITVDTMAPAVPALGINAVTSGNVINIAESQADTTTLTGTIGALGAGDTVTAVKVTIGNETVDATVTGNTWSLDVATTKLTGFLQKKVSAALTVSDAAGNLSTGPTANKNFTVDLTPPDAPFNLDLAAADDKGLSNSDNVTNATTQTVSVSMDLNGMLSFFNDTNGNGQKDANEASLVPVSVNNIGSFVNIGFFDAVFNLAEGNYNIRALATDVAGNTAASAPLAITVDTTAAQFSAGTTGSLNENTTDTGLALVANEVVAFAIDGSGADDSKFKFDNNGKLVFFTAPNFEAQGSAAGTNTYTVKIKMTDVAGNISTQDVTVTVNGVDEAPVIDIAPQDAIDWQENSPATDLIFDFDATDPDAGDDPVTWALGGDDAAFFSIDADGKLTFNESPDFENPNHGPSYSLTVIAKDASDGTLTTETAVTVTVTNVDDNVPEITSGDTGSIAENSPASSFVYQASGNDADGTPITWSLDGVDKDAFSIDQNGKVTINASPDYEIKNSYTIIITASSGDISFTKQVTISVTNDTADDVGPDITPPAKLAVSLAGAENAAIPGFGLIENNGGTNSLTPVIRGTGAEAGGSVQVTITTSGADTNYGNGGKSYNATIQPDGSWFLDLGESGVDDLSGAASDSYTIQVTHRDAANNATASDSFSLNLIGKDLLTGQFTGTSQADYLVAEASGSTIAGSNGNDTLIGGNGDDTLSGQDDSDILSGKDGIDTLVGGLGDDRIDGGVGNDTLTGGLGVDKLTGGAGADQFNFALGDTDVTNGIIDTITDFETGTDKIGMDFAVGFLTSVSGTNMGTLADFLAAIDFSGGRAYSAWNHNNSGDGYLALDTNNNGSFDAAQDVVIKLMGYDDASKLGQTDFLQLMV